MRTILNSDRCRIIVFDPQPKSFDDDDNLDVEVVCPNGERYSATFFTIGNIRHLFQKNKQTGECASGTYLYTVNMVIVVDLTDSTIIATVEHLLDEGTLPWAFGRLSSGIN